MTLTTLHSRGNRSDPFVSSEKMRPGFSSLGVESRKRNTGSWFRSRKLAIASILLLGWIGTSTDAPKAYNPAAAGSSESYFLPGSRGHSPTKLQNRPIIERYLEAMNSPGEYFDTDFSFTAEFQKKLYQHQNPASCANSKFLIYYVWSHGFGSFARGMLSALALAVSQGRILLLAVGPVPEYKRKAQSEQVWKTWHHGIGCNKVHPECFFKPVSNCSLKRVHEMMLADRISYAELESDVEMPVLPNGKTPRVLVARGKLSWLVGLRRNLPIEKALEQLRMPQEIRSNEYFGSPNGYVRNRMWSVQALVYLLRLNLRMQRFVKPALEQCFGSKSPNYNRIVGVPIRRSDKCYREVDGKRHGEAKCVSLEDTLKLAQQIHSSQPWVDTLLVTSEDRSVIQEMATMKGMTLGSDPRMKWNLLTNEADVQQGTGRSYESAHVNLSTAKTPKKLRPLTPANITESLLTSIACQVLPSHRILLLHSNFADTIDLLSKAVPGRKSGVTINSGTPAFPR